MKKQTPLTVLAQLEKFVDLQGKDFVRAESPNSIIKYVDTDDKSSFYFDIKQYKNGESGNGFKVLINHVPYSHDLIEGKDRWIDIKTLSELMTYWIGLLNRYNTIKSPFDDPILEHHYNFYYSDFQFPEDEEDNTPLNPENIFLLDDYLEKVSIFLNESNHQDVSGIEELQSDIAEIRENLGRKSKKWLANKTAWMWARATKLGPKIMKGLLDEANKRIVKESFDATITIGKNIIENF